MFYTNKYGLPNKNTIKTKSYELFNELLEREGKVRMIRTKISGLVRNNENESKNGIFNLLDNLKNDYKDGILPNKKFSSPAQNKSLSFKNLKVINEEWNSQTKLKDKENTKENKKESNKRSKSEINKINKINKYKENKKNKNIKYKDILNLFSNMKMDKKK